MGLCVVLLVINAIKNDTFYRVSYSCLFKVIELEAKYSRDFISLDNALEYMDSIKSKEAGKNFTIEKVVTTYEVIGSG